MRIPLRISVVLWAIILVVLLGYSISRLLFFKSIFFAHAGIRLTQPQVATAAVESKEAGASQRVQHIPKIIHNVFHNWHVPGDDTLPKDMAEMRQTCIDTNPDFEFKLWTEKMSRDFIEEEYPWFLRTYDGYRYPVQRVDAVRYFIMQHYGGIYMDLDNGCKTDLTPLLYYPLWTTDGGRGALSNNILGSRPNHPFWHRLTLSLIPYDWKWPLPFVTIMYASGQWFLTAMWEEYHALLPRPVAGDAAKNAAPGHEHRLYRVMMDMAEGADPWVFFSHQDGGGGTWNNWDNTLFAGIGDHLLLFFVVLFAGLGLLTWVSVRCVRRYRKKKGYTRLSNRSSSSVA
ncbi:nucleotide-diphospho-sugar transferase [Dichotomopilus funicola]|uniref:Nucleotide-diphospho-sugar transferase n=1 Tax=Dichotomopilus funicola TaxID=1934379 RepID=A0AAN6V1S3_9PEZI|nr:nucleotide-diphospho-sugar transferase [Dichotomopilus funicola]